jgi:hypothetical protein
MSWEGTRYVATCKACGHTGVCIQGSDDWMRTRTLWEGFSSVAPDPTAVARKRLDAGDSVAICSCGSSNIEVGGMLPDVR